MDINSKEYWDYRFNTDWEQKKGKEQSEFFYKLIIKHMPEWLKKDMSVKYYNICDIGCAMGEGVNLFSQSFPLCEVTGIDISDVAINKARSLYTDCNFICGDFKQKNNIYDIIISSNTIEHFKNPFEIVEDMLHICNQFVILLVPFRERDKIDEHFFTFDYGNIPSIIGNDNLLYIEVINCKEIENTYWMGKQMLLIYSKNFI
jgi:2-polyprenyl-3-methyl-5-hydroxy-6-metoxy-1,4-benzoquinol methylase